MFLWEVTSLSNANSNISCAKNWEDSRDLILFFEFNEKNCYCLNDYCQVYNAGCDYFSDTFAWRGSGVSGKKAGITNHNKTMAINDKTMVITNVITVQEKKTFEIAKTCFTALSSCAEFLPLKFSIWQTWFNKLFDVRQLIQFVIVPF